MIRMFWASIACSIVMSFIPPQTSGEFPHEFGGEPIKPRRRKALSKEVSQLIMCRDEFKHHISPEDFLTNKMVVNLNVLSTGMEDRISCNGQSTHIVTPEEWRMRKENAKIAKKHTDPI